LLCWRSPCSRRRRHSPPPRPPHSGNANFLTTGISGPGQWLALSAGRVRVAPHSSRQVAYTVSIPRGITGAHYAGIVALNAADLRTPAIRRRSKSKSTGVTIYRISRQALPITIRIPGPLTRSLALRSVNLSVGSAGAALMLGLLPGGTELTEAAQVDLRVLRGAQTIFKSATGLGQLFPVGGLPVISGSVRGRRSPAFGPLES
jgi:hypothetical protein